MSNHLAITFLCTFASNGYDQYGSMTTCIEGVSTYDPLLQMQEVRIETGLELNPATFNNHQFYHVVSSRFMCEDDVLVIESASPTLIVNLEIDLHLAKMFHDFMAARQRVFMSDQDELRVLGLMITQPTWITQFVTAYKHYIFSTPARQCMFKVLRHIGVQDHLPLKDVMQLNHANGREMFTDQEVGLAVNAASEISQEKMLRYLYIRDALNREYDNQDTPYFSETLGFRTYDSI